VGQSRSKPTSRMGRPPRQIRPSRHSWTDARTVLARKGSLRRAKKQARPCALRAVPADQLCDGRLRRDGLGSFVFDRTPERAYLKPAS
jgi:hypothetical protein